MKEKYFVQFYDAKGLRLVIPGAENNRLAHPTRDSALQAAWEHMGTLMRYRDPAGEWDKVRHRVAQVIVTPPSGTREAFTATTLRAALQEVIA